jgi:glycosyltransferase involved in cell wall biosynthesis
MNIVQLISSGGLYGAEVMVLHLMRALRNRGENVTLGVIVNRRNPHRELLRKAREAGIEAVEIPCRGRADLATVRRVRELVKATGAHIVHSHGYKSNLYALAAKGGGRFPLVSTCHNWTNQSAALRFYAMLDRLALRRFERVFCVSAAVRLKLLNSGISERNAQLVENGVPLLDFCDSAASLVDIASEQGPRIGMVGRLVEQKGFQLVLKAAPHILKRFPKARFIVVGDGPYREELTSLARQLRIESSVSFLGRRDDMPGVYRSLDVFVLPSLNEGMPMTLLEAMAAGVPAIATRVGAVPSIIDHQETGVLVEPGRIEPLQYGLEHLLETPELRLRLGRNGQAWVRAHASIEATAEKYAKHYRDLLPFAA